MSKFLHKFAAKEKACVVISNTESWQGICGEENAKSSLVNGEKKEEEVWLLVTSL